MSTEIFIKIWHITYVVFSKVIKTAPSLKYVGLHLWSKILGENKYKYKIFSSFMMQTQPFLYKNNIFGLYILMIHDS